MHKKDWRVRNISCRFCQRLKLVFGRSFVMRSGKGQARTQFTQQQQLCRCLLAMALCLRHSRLRGAPQPAWGSAHYFLVDDFWEPLFPALLIIRLFLKDPREAHETEISSTGTDSAHWVAMFWFFPIFTHESRSVLSDSCDPKDYTVHGISSQNTE